MLYSIFGVYLSKMNVNMPDELRSLRVSAHKKLFQTDSQVYSIQKTFVSAPNFWKPRFNYIKTWFNVCLPTDKVVIQRALCICRFHSGRFNQLRIKNVQGGKYSRKFQKQNLNLPCRQLLTWHLHCIYNYLRTFTLY